MTEDRLPLADLLAKAGDGDFLRSVAEAVVQLLMETDVEGVIGAGRHERSGERTTYRVSTDRQGKSGLGLQAQRDAVASYVAGTGGLVAAEFEEVESGKRNDRPQLAAALAACRARRAALIIAKLDRLARNARFLLHVVEGTGEAGVVFCDLPSVPPGPVGKFLLTQMAAVAELEAGLISQRTKAALAAAKARGVRLGNPHLRAGSPEHARAAAAIKSRQARAKAADVIPYIEAAQRAGASTLTELAEALTNRGVPTPAGKSCWRPEQVRRVLQFQTMDWPASGLT